MTLISHSLLTHDVPQVCPKTFQTYVKALELHRAQPKPPSPQDPKPWSCKASSCASKPLSRSRRSRIRGLPSAALLARSTARNLLAKACAQTWALTWALNPKDLTFKALNLQALTRKACAQTWALTWALHS